MLARAVNKNRAQLAPAMEIASRQTTKQLGRNLLGVMCLRCSVAAFVDTVPAPSTYRLLASAFSSIFY